MNQFAISGRVRKVLFADSTKVEFVVLTHEDHPQMVRVESLKSADGKPPAVHAEGDDVEITGRLENRHRTFKGESLFAADGKPVVDGVLVAKEVRSMRIPERQVPTTKTPPPVIQFEQRPAAERQPAYQPAYEPRQAAPQATPPRRKSGQGESSIRKGGQGNGPPLPFAT
jgi:hypothetical protein